MYINDKCYSVGNDIQDMNDIRCLFHSYLYNDKNYIDSLQTILERYIDILQLSYDPCNKSFVIKIKKTAMKKQSKFEHNANFYYKLIVLSFKDFLIANKNQIIQILSYKYLDCSRDVYDMLINNENYLSMMCNIVCIGTNVILINL